MGSQLVDRDGKLLWGVSPRLLVRQLLRGDLLSRLRVRPNDGIRPFGLVRVPGLIPGLGSLDPYARLATALRDEILVHEAALLEFAYDWRLSIDHAARELARAAERHLDDWRAHPRGNPDARLRLVCHSLGGLVAQYFTEVLDGRAITHQTITLGTPHHGSVRALAALANAPTPRHGLMAAQVRALSRTLPSVHELIPRYACVAAAPGEPPRRLEASDLDGLGVARQLADAAHVTHRALHDAATTAGGLACPVRARVGITQPTPQTVTIEEGTVVLHERIDGEDRSGDGTVYRDAGCPIGVQPDYVPQRHGRLASAPEAIAYVHAVLTERSLGPPMGHGIGIDVPSTVAAGQRLVVRIVAQPGTRVHCHAIDQDTGRQVSAAVATDDQAGVGLVASLALPRPGLYAVDAKAGGHSAVGELVLAHD
jgi:hypothetical protein